MSAHLSNRSIVSTRRPAVVLRPTVRLTQHRSSLPTAIPSPAPPAYLDYARQLTPEGGVLIIDKDIDTRWRWWVWRILAWSAATSFDGWIAFDQSPLQSGWLAALCWLVAAALNLFIVWAAIRVDRRIEVRPDCLILESREVFWRQYLEGSRPELHPKDETTFVLAGIYGTRFVEFGTLRRFDDNDRQPETFAAHFKQAIEQIWVVR